jgi:hypothetical protein
MRGTRLVLYSFGDGPSPASAARQDGDSVRDVLHYGSRAFSRSAMSTSIFRDVSWRVMRKQEVTLSAIGRSCAGRAAPWAAWHVPECLVADKRSPHLAPSWHTRREDSPKLHKPVACTSLSGLLIPMNRVAPAGRPLICCGPFPVKEISDLSRH